MRISDIMTVGVECADTQCSVSDAARRMLNSDIGAIPVVEDGRPVGMLTDRDIAIRVAATGRNPLTTRAGDVMTHELVCCSSSDTLDSAARVMEKHQVRRLLVLDDDDRLCGILSLGDLAVRTGRDTLSEEVLEEVSRPGHLRGQRDAPTTRSSRARALAWRSAVRRLHDAAIPLLAGFAAGAAATYSLYHLRAGRRSTTVCNKSARPVPGAQGVHRELAGERAHQRGEALLAP